MLRQKCSRDVRAFRASRRRETNLGEVCRFAAIIALSTASKVTVSEVMLVSTEKAFLFLNSDRSRLIFCECIMSRRYSPLIK